MARARVLAFWRSTIGKKVVMAVTGAIGIGYVIVHAAGNLLVFAGPEAINQYAAALKGNFALLWTIRAVLLAAVVLHVVAAAQLTLLNRAARPVGYHSHEPQVSTWSSRSMRIGGVLLLVFIVFHLLHLTLGRIDPAGVFTVEDVHRNVVASFRIWWVTLIYVLALFALALHLFHGVWSSARTVGVARQSLTPLRRRAAWVIGVAVWAAFTAVPLAVYFGFVR